LHESTLHRMQFAILRKAFDGCYLVAVGAKGWDKAAMDGDAVQPYGTGAAIAGIATLLDSKPSHVTQKGSQALTRPWFFRERFAVNQITHSCT
jgi:hypothetical protein